MEPWSILTVWFFLLLRTTIHLPSQASRGKSRLWRSWSAGLMVSHLPCFHPSILLPIHKAFSVHSSEISIPLFFFFLLPIFSCCFLHSFLFSSVSSIFSFSFPFFWNTPTHSCINTNTPKITIPLTGLSALGRPWKTTHKCFLVCSFKFVKKNKQWTKTLCI